MKSHCRFRDGVPPKSSLSVRATDWLPSVSGLCAGGVRGDYDRAKHELRSEPGKADLFLTAERDAYLAEPQRRCFRTAQVCMSAQTAQSQSAPRPI